MDSHPLYEWHKLCRICLKNDLLVSIYSPTFLLRPIEIIEKLHIFKPDDTLPTLLCQSCLYRLLDAYNLQQMAEASERRLRDYCSISGENAGCSLSLITSNHEVTNFSSPKLDSCNLKGIDTTPPIYDSFCEMFERNVQSNDIEVVADDVLNDVEIDVSSLTRSEADDSLSEVFVGNHGSANSDCEMDKSTAEAHNSELESNKSFVHMQKRKALKHCRSNSKILKIPDKCGDCGKTFKYHGYLETHKRLHTGEKPFKCKLCSRCFSQSSNLLLHERTHTGERRFQCEICSNFFSTSSNLKDHMLTHLNRRDVQCNLCSRSFNSLRELRRHEPIHKAIKDIMCAICSKAFTKRSYLSAHVAAVHRGVRRHKCTECSKVFSSKSNLVCHLRTHTGEKPFQCKRCSWRFNQSSALIRHMKKHAKSNDVGTVVVKNQPDPSLAHSMISNFLHASEFVDVNASLTAQGNFNMLQNLSNANVIP